jgi:predicted nucleic acid-binding protein
LQDLFAHKPVVACATLGLIEVTATLARKGKAGQLGLSALEQKLQEVETDWQNFIQIQFLAEVVVRAKDLARTLALRGADSIHLASALSLQSRLPQGDQVIFITSDQELKFASQMSNLIPLDPNEEEAENSL